MKCHWCDKEPVAACPRCGRFHCSVHGGGPAVETFCHEHAEAAMDEVRWSGILGVLISGGTIAGGIFWLFLLSGVLWDKETAKPFTDLDRKLAWLFGGMGTFWLLLGLNLLARVLSSGPGQPRAADPPARGTTADVKRLPDAVTPERPGPRTDG